MDTGLSIASLRYQPPEGGSLHQLYLVSEVGTPREQRFVFGDFLEVGRWASPPAAFQKVSALPTDIRSELRGAEPPRRDFAPRPAPKPLLTRESIGADSGFVEAHQAGFPVGARNPNLDRLFERQGEICRQPPSTGE